MKRFHVIAWVLLSLLAVSCVGDLLQEEIYVDPQEEGLVERTFEVICDADDITEESTKSTISGNSPVWEIGDSVSVYDPLAGSAKIFKVVSKNGGKVQISGTISAGTFAFSAVYPASCVKSWTDIENPVYSIPATQVIARDRVIARNVLVSKAYAAAGKDIVFKNQTSLLQFKIGSEGVEKVELKLKSSSSASTSYTVRIQDTLFTKDKVYYASVAAGTYASGIDAVCTTNFDISYTKSSTKSLEAKLNGQRKLGDIFNSKSKHINYNITETGAINGGVKGFLGNFVGQEEIEEYDWIYKLVTSTYSGLLTKYAPSYDKDATTIDFTYKSIDHWGNPVTQSAAIIYPAGSIKGIVLSNHFSMVGDADCPTRKLQYEAGFCYKGYVVVMPDNLGFGASSKYPQAYMNTEVTARGDIDALLAAKQLLSDKGVSVGSQIINFGYSQGGHSAMANVKYVSEHPELGVNFTRTFAGGGPHDMEYTWAHFLKGECHDVVPYILLAIVSYVEGEKLDVDYSQVFQAKYCVPGASNNIKEIICAKKYDTGDLMNRVGTYDLTQILTPEMLAGTCDAYGKLLQTAKKDGLNRGSWNVASGSSSIYIYHSRNDNYIPYDNMSRMSTYLKAHGSTPVCRDLQDVYDNDFYIQKYKHPNWLVHTSLDYTDEYAVYAVVKELLEKSSYKIDSIDHVTGAVICAIDMVLNHWPS